MKVARTFFKAITITSTTLLLGLAGCAFDEPIDYTTGGYDAGPQGDAGDSGSSEETSESSDENEEAFTASIKMSARAPRRENRSKEGFVVAARKSTTER